VLAGLVGRSEDWLSKIERENENPGGWMCWSM